MKLSIVVSSYGRFSCIQNLVQSARTALPEGAYQVVAVCSDHPDSSKSQWLKAQPDVVYIQGDVRHRCRLKSLYAYENMGIKAAQGEWLFVTNDDTTLEPDFWDKFVPHSDNYDVILVSGHLGEVGLGCRKAVIGTITPPDGVEKSLYLYDFTLIRKSTYEQIGYLDEKLDWFGKGFDLAMSCETALGVRVCYDADVRVNHVIEAENRRPPHYERDFRYATDKWMAWCVKTGWRFTWPW